MQAQPRLHTVHASRAAVPPRDPKPQQSRQSQPQPQQSRQPQQHSKSDPNDIDLAHLLHESGSARKLLDLVQRHHQLFNRIYAVTALQTLANLAPRMRAGFASHAAWPLLLALVQHLIPQIDARQLSSSVCACGKLNIEPT